MKRSAALVVLLALTLTGCTPNTDEAYKACFAALDQLAAEKHPDHEPVERMVTVADICSDEAKKDPWAFNEQWGS